MEIVQLSRGMKQDVIEQIKRYFAAERDEAISDFQAENLLNFILATIGPAIYNQAIEDAYTVMNEKTEELFGLQKRSR
ncbi:hypothetical protein AXX12_05940 [Anaerosporomusa subterranea]|uniref:DUF2164 domain-containing protein n=1 Tax=Anaerosporomusa subterranea TaxID=1794912 RepID=A0A154BQ00_ANASB|nr:DUF2164 domain-containing protein [Anaerosporomusa subterranea]KYZ75979.1 hypothetical protein AXX12_05940 [Anaerosporomusa subterranea]